MIDLHLRQLRREDFPLLQASCYPSHHQPRLFSNFERSLERQAAGTGIHLVAFSGEVLVATAQLLRLGRGSEIAEVVVTQSLRGRGIGTRLIRYLLAEAQHRDWQPVDIVVTPQNPRARALYERLGFTFAHTIALPTNEQAHVLRWWFGGGNRD